MNRVEWVKSDSQYDDSGTSCNISRTAAAQALRMWRAFGLKVHRSTPMRMTNYNGKPRVQRRYMAADANDNVAVIHTYNWRMEPR